MLQVNLVLVTALFSSSSELLNQEIVVYTHSFEYLVSLLAGDKLHVYKTEAVNQTNKRSVWLYSIFCLFFMPGLHALFMLYFKP